MYSNSLLTVLIMVFIYTQIIPNNYVLMKESFQMDICDENYIDAAFIVDDGIKISRGSSLWTYDLSFDFISLHKQEDDLEKYDKIVRNGIYLTGFYVPEVTCKSDDNLPVPPQQRVNNNSSSTDSNTIKTNSNVVDTDCNTTETTSDVFDTVSNKTETTPNVFEPLPCKAVKERNSYLKVFIFRDLDSDTEMYHFKRKTAKTYEEIDQNSSPYNLFSRGKLVGELLPNATSFGTHHKHLPFIYDHKELKVIVIRNRVKDKDDVTLNINSLKYLNFKQTWTITNISNSYTYIGFVRKDGNIYAIAEPFKKDSKTRGPTKLLLFDTEKLSFKEEFTDAMSLFGCEPAVHVIKESDEFIAYAVLAVIIAVFAAIIVVLIFHILITLVSGKQKIKVIKAEP